MKKIKENLSLERKEYLLKNKRKKILIAITQISLLIFFIFLWELLANLGIIDSFLTSQPSRILKTFIEMSSNIFNHLKVTFLETIIGFLLGTLIGTLIACFLWWSPFASKVFEPFLIILNSLPKVALRTNYNSMGWSWHTSYNNYGSRHLFDCNNFRNVKWI